MRNRIAVLFFDALADEHDYSQIRLNDVPELYEKEFDVKINKNTDSVNETLNTFRGVDAIITIGNDLNFKNLNELSFEYRKKWAHIDEFNVETILDCITSIFKTNVTRETPNENKKFSIFTSVYRTSDECLTRLHNSLLNQTYKEWNWFILDDSNDNGETVNRIMGLQDPNIHIISNVTRHGCIGYNKHMIAMACDGDYLVEVDHDDELTPNCLEEMKNAFDAYPDTDFVYTNAMEVINGKEGIYYGDGWIGGYQNKEVFGTKMRFPCSPDITRGSIKKIYTQPNHARCWKKDFYHRIGGHNTELSVLDDMDILIRTFLNGKMTKVDDFLYIQYEGERNGSDSNTQNRRFNEIQRTCQLLYETYNGLVDKRCAELGNKLFYNHIYTPSYKTIDIFYVATGIYKAYFNKFIETVDKFFPAMHKNIHVLSDGLKEYDKYEGNKFNVEVNEIFQMTHSMSSFYKLYYPNYKLNECRGKYMFYFDSDTYFLPKSEEYWEELQKTMDENNVIMSIHPYDSNNGYYPLGYFNERSSAYIGKPQYDTTYIISSLYGCNVETFRHFFETIDFMINEDQHYLSQDKYIPPINDENYFVKIANDSLDGKNDIKISLKNYMHHGEENSDVFRHLCDDNFIIQKYNTKLKTR